MAIRINTNVAAMNALRNVGITSTEFSKSVTRLSTGLRINSAADDPAGLIISQKLGAQISGLDQAVRNSQDGVNMVKTAEGAMDEVNKLLKDARGLAVAASNTATQDSGSLQALQNQLTSITSSINRIASTTSFGAKKLLDGTAGASAAISDTVDVSGITLSGTFNGQAIASGTVTMDQTTAATKVSFAPTDVDYADADAVLGVSGAIVLNGVSIGYEATDTIGAFTQKINTFSGQTGVLAAFDGTNVAITQQGYGANNKVTIQDTGSIISTAAYSSVSGVNAAVTVSAVVYNSLGATAVATAAFVGGRATGDSGLKLTDSYGNTMNVTETGNGVSAATSVALSISNALTFQLGANVNETGTMSLANMAASNLGTTAVSGKNLSSVDLTSLSGAGDAIRVIDEAINQVTTTRGTLGSFQRNVLESNIRSLNVTKENLTASMSSIQDVDVAEEITNFTKQQILQQSGLSVLAQANSAPQAVLSLLR
jgi:flagellin